MTVWPARRMRSRMLPPILPRPMRPSCMSVHLPSGCGCSGGAAAQRAVRADQGLRRGVEAGDLGAFGEGGLHALGEDLAELDAPLVEGVDVPDGALDEDLLLVEGDELAEDR